MRQAVRAVRRGAERLRHLRRPRREPRRRASPSPRAGTRWRGCGTCTTAGARGLADGGSAPPDFDEFWAAGCLETAGGDEPTGAVPAVPRRPGGRTRSARRAAASRSSRRPSTGSATRTAPGHPTWLEPTEWLGAPLAGRFPLQLVANNPTARLHSQLDVGASARRPRCRAASRSACTPPMPRPAAFATATWCACSTTAGAVSPAPCVTDAVRPGVVQLSTGAWYDPLDPADPDAMCVHGNPNVLTFDRGTSKLAQGCSGQHALVEVERWTGPLPADPRVRSARARAPARSLIPWRRRTSRTCWWIPSSPQGSRGSTAWRATRSTASRMDSPAREHAVDPRAARGDGRIRRGRGGASDGPLAVCAGSCGPGNLHLINGLYDCHRSRVPVLAIAAQIPSHEIGSGYFQETRPEASVRRVQPLLRAGVPARADAARAGDRDADRARAARGRGDRRCPATWPCAMRSSRSRALQFPRADADGVPVRGRRSRRWPTILNGAKKVTILGGAGCAGAHAELIAAGGQAEGADRARDAGQGVHRVRQPVRRGHDGPARDSRPGYHAMMNCDSLLMLGTDFPYRQFYPEEGDDRADRHPRRADRPAHEGRSRPRGRHRGRRSRAAAAPASSSGDDKHLAASLEHYRKARQGLDELATGEPGKKPHPSAVRGPGARRAGRRRRDVLLRRGHADHLGGPLPDDERQAAVARLVQSRVDGERPAAGDRRAGQPPGPSGRLAVGRRRAGDAAGRSALAAAARVCR